MSDAYATGWPAVSAAGAPIAAIDAAPVRRRSALGAVPRALSCDWAPAGYDESDLRILEWIASYRKRACGRMGSATSARML